MKDEILFLDHFSIIEAKLEREELPGKSISRFGLLL
jgi:hypothetical protein